jgi:hypothetical protein
MIDYLCLHLFRARFYIKKCKVVPTHEIFTNSLHCTGSLVFLAHIGGHFTDRSTWRQEAQQSPVFQFAVCWR